MDKITLFLCNTHIRWWPFQAHFRENFDSLKITNYPGLIPFFQPGKLFRGQKCLSTNFRAKKNFFSNFFFFEKTFFSKFLQIFWDFFLENSDAHECAQKCLAPKNTQINAPLNFPGAPWRIFGAPENLTKISKISQQILSASFEFLGSRN